MKKPKWPRKRGNSKPVEIALTAVHEAAHAVALILLEIKSLGATTKPRLEADGSVCHGMVVLDSAHWEQRLRDVASAKANGDAREAVKPLLISRLVGPIAEARARGNKVDKNCVPEDIAEVTGLALFAICPGVDSWDQRPRVRPEEPYRTQVMELVQTAIESAIDLVRNLEPTILSVAQKLYETGEMRTPDIEALMRETLPGVISDMEARLGN